MYVPGRPIDQADYVLIAEVVGVERWEQQASELVQRLADDLDPEKDFPEGAGW